MSSEYERGKIPWEREPLITDPGYVDFQRGREAAAVQAERHQAALDGLSNSVARMFARGGWAAFKRAIAELVAVPLIVGLVGGLVAYFLNGNYERTAAISWGVTFALLLGFGALLFAVYIVVRHGALLLLAAIVAGLAIAGLHSIGVVPKFW